MGLLNLFKRNYLLSESEFIQKLLYGNPLKYKAFRSIRNGTIDFKNQSESKKEFMDMCDYIWETNDKLSQKDIINDI